MISTNTKNAQHSERKEATLASRYGEIGIPAVAAALQYKSNARNPVSSPGSVLTVRRPSFTRTGQRTSTDLAA